MNFKSDINSEINIRKFLIIFMTLITIFLLIIFTSLTVNAEETTAQETTETIETTDDNITDYLQLMLVMQMLQFGAFLGYVAIDRLR